MKLYGINKDTLELVSVEIAKETSKFYVLSKRISWLNYHKRVYKNHRAIHTTPEDAIENFRIDLESQIDSKRLEVLRLQEKLDEFNERTMVI